MFHPTSWNEMEEINPRLGPDSVKHGLKYPLPDVYCDGSQGLNCSRAAIKRGMAAAWFTNYTFVTYPTLPNYMFNAANPGKKKKTHPWASPGSAHVHGEGCGANGGNPFPYGCNHDAKFDNNPYGTCCPGGGYSYLNNHFNWTC